MDSLDAMVDSTAFTASATLGTSYLLNLPKLGVKEVTSAVAHAIQPSLFIMKNASLS